MGSSSVVEVGGGGHRDRLGPAVGVCHENGVTPEE
jgi:hypothetical protein